MNDKGDPPVTGVLKMRVEGQPVEPRITHEVLKVTEYSRADGDIGRSKGFVGDSGCRRLHNH
jgi:hypothetical protein